MSFQINEVITQCIREKQNGKLITYCHGCFDFLHPGHIAHLEDASKNGDILFVSVTDDKYVNKGIGRPIFTAQERCVMLSSLKFVNYVAINDAQDSTKVIMALKPDFYVKGVDYKNISCDEFKAVTAMGGKMIFTDTPKYSTTEIIERIRNAV